MAEFMFSTTLFTVGTFPMVFVMEKTSENEIISQMIQHGGGCISSVKGPYGICLSTPKKSRLRPNEAIFSTEFIKDCCMTNKILDINMYRLSSSSRYPDNINVMKVLLRQSHWPTSEKRDDNESANTDRHSASDTTVESQKSRKNISVSQRTFSGSEEREILRYIVENQEIGLILGNTLWKKIAQRKVQGRTWQSLKKYFLKHMLPNITKYTFLSATEKLEFQKHLHKTAGSDAAPSSSSRQVSQRHVEKSNRLPSLHKTAGSGDAACSSSRQVSQRHVERSNRLPSPSESSVSNDGSNLERDQGRRLPEKRKPFQMPRAHESSGSDSSGCSANTDDQRLQHIHQLNRSTSSQVQHANKDDRHPRKQDDLRHPEKNKASITQRSQSVVNSSDEVVSGSEEDHRATIEQRRNDDQRQETVINSSYEVDSGSGHHSSSVVQSTNNEQRNTQDTSSSDDWFVATDQEQHHGTLKAIHNKPRKLRKRRREEFTMEEEYAIIEYLKKHNRFANTGGNNVWKTMAATQPVGRRHTWHSLRERYLKKMVPNINKYNLPDNVVKLIKRK